MAKLRPISITFVVAAKYLKGAKAEISRELTLCGEDVQKRIRFLPVEQGDDNFDPAIFEQYLLATWKQLFDGDSTMCEALDGTPYALRLLESPLSAVVIDIILMESFNALRERQKIATSFKFFTWLPVAINTILSLCRFDAIPLVESAAAQMEVSFNEAARHLMLVPSGQVVRHPGLPDMYDHEYQPQAQTDGVPTFDAADYYPEAVSEFRSWFAETSRKVYYVGPLVPDGSALASSPQNGRRAQGGVLSFLDDHLTARGERSVVYISFGSLFWPSDPGKVHAVLEVLINRNIPFILTHPSALAVLSHDTLAMLSECKSAFVTQWAPQQAILEHPATGWCLTHGGHNTVLECIAAEVPMILWPIFTDQPVNAIHLTDHLDVAYELLEVRHGTGLGPIFRTGKTPTGTLAAVREELGKVLECAFGEDGQAKRKRLQVLRTTLDQAWAEDGVARAEVESFLEDLP
ncbi:UDP-Glycosyltransferase/glycogen phosphorylase [Trametes versicolor FP-101664 SS1]|uniref:UDP-Glycosyltransferase/glycogen phosphorylase n=1 Tax=Trametes versicolor (strain FP-101664) TaxID=717944 RepID=UPI0004623671|nr:UDP-Glycosyltransferase/glycogen phosphorylase [Trametes versicolor FP-101664 SS1]EIW53235.1 UDP-Glycosyltransferase/glycogen phosphorylase [Trametes versicolor FP-101664 SS1]